MFEFLINDKIINMQDSYSQPSLYCDGKGNWTMSQGSCYCKAGFEPDNKMTNCSRKFFVLLITCVILFIKRQKNCSKMLVPVTRCLTSCCYNQTYFPRKLSIHKNSFSLLHEKLKKNFFNVLLLIKNFNSQKKVLLF